jgi:hypothetical protein
MMPLSAARFLAGAVILSVLSGCASSPPGPAIRSNVDDSANLSAYRTYAFVPTPGTEQGNFKKPVTAWFKTAVSRELESRGYRPAQEGANADLLVNFNATVEEAVDFESRVSPVDYYGYRPPDLYGPIPQTVPSGSELEVVRFKAGTANVDVVDARRKHLVWEGIAEGRLTEEAFKDPQPAIDEVVRLIFQEFPGKASP